MYPDAKIPQVMPKARHSYFTAFIVATVFVVVFLAISIWAYLGKSDAENNLDDHIALAVNGAEEALTTELNAQFDEAYKEPFRTVSMVEDLGGVTFQFPRNWGVYVVENDSSSKPLDLFAHPNVVPNISGETAFGLRLQIVGNSYDDELGDFDKDIEKGLVTTKAVRSNSVLGTKIQGEIFKDINGIMAIFPLRDKTLMIWTESTKYKTDFNTALEALVFTP